MVENFEKIKLEDETRSSPPKKLPHFGFFVAGLFLLCLLFSIPLIILVNPLLSSGKKAWFLTSEAYNAVKSQDLGRAETGLKEAKKAIIETKNHYKKLFFLKYLPLISVYYNDGENVLEALETGVEAGEVLIEAVMPYADVLGFSGEKTSGVTAEDRLVKIIQTLDKVAPKIKEISGKFEKANESLQKIDPNRYPEEIKGKKIKENIVKGKNLVNDIALVFSDIQPILASLPTMLGYPEPRKYLVIFQNDGELRPTGGFMTAYAIMRFESGRVRAEKSEDIYTLDKRFGRGIEAPEMIKKYLPLVSYWHLRDMNLSPDFKLSMETFKKYYDKTEGVEKIDGIMAVDTKVLTDLVALLGPIDVPGYGEFNIEKDPRCHNIPQIVCELEYIADMPIPGVKVARKDVLGPLMQAILAKAMGAPRPLWSQLFKTALSWVSEKHFLLYYEEEKLQQAVEVFGAAGRVEDFDGDYLHINDTNFAGAKSNMFVKHEVLQEIEIGNDGTVTKTLTLTYNNPEERDDCGLERKEGLCLNGDLRNYIRIYVPLGSKLIESLGSEVEVGEKQELGKTYFDGFFVVRGGGGRAKMIVKYELPFKVSKGEEYKLLIQKQPGTLGHDYVVKIKGQEESFKLTTDKELKFKI